MDPRLLEYYNQELLHVRETAAEFAEEFPKVAGRLALSGLECADPYVERLLEGFAYLAARVQLKIDAEYPRFTQHLTEIVYPDYLCPLPSMAIARFVPDMADGALIQGFDLGRGTVLHSRKPIDAITQCDFSTAHGAKLFPIQVAEASYRAYTGELPAGPPSKKPPRAVLRIRLRTAAGVNFSDLQLSRLPVFLGGADTVAHRIYEQLLAAAEGYVVLACGSGTVQGGWQPKSNIREMGFGDDESLLPVSARTFQGHRLLQEYLAFPSRYLFVEFAGLDACVRGAQDSQIDIVVPLSSYERSLEGAVSGEDFLLFCTPVINLQPKRADRIHLTNQYSEHHVVVDRTRPMDFEVFQVTKVVGYGAGVESWQEFRPFYAVLDEDAPDRTGAYYTVHRVPRVLSEKQKRVGPRSSYVGSEVFLSLVDEREGPFVSDTRQLSVETLCTNRDLPMRMPLGVAKGDFTLDVSAPVEMVRCVKGPTPPYPSHPAGESSWRLIGLLAQNYLSLLDTSAQRGAEALRDLLSLSAGHTDKQIAKQIEGLRSVHAKRIVRRLPTPGPVTFGRGIGVDLEIDETPLGGSGAFMMGSVLRHYLSRHASLNSFVETALTVTGRGEVIRWPAKIGSRPIL